MKKLTYFDVYQRDLKLLTEMRATYFSIDISSFKREDIILLERVIKVMRRGGDNNVNNYIKLEKILYHHHDLVGLAKIQNKDIVFLKVEEVMRKGNNIIKDLHSYYKKAKKYDNRINKFGQNSKKWNFKALRNNLKVIEKIIEEDTFDIKAKEIINRMYFENS